MGKTVVQQTAEVAEIPWTQFWDMHSGGDSKENFERIFIQAPEDEAAVIFYNRFGHNPYRVSCTCCGPDYSVSEIDTDPVTYVKGDSEYLRSGLVFVIPADMIQPHERQGELPSQSYIGVD